MERYLRNPSMAGVRSIENLPGAIISFSCSGDISTFSPELLDIADDHYGDFTWGNVHRVTWLDIRSNPRLLHVSAAIARGVERCRRECGFFTVCGGGAPSNKLGEHGSFDSTETLDCRLRVQVVADAYLTSIGV